MSNKTTPYSPNASTSYLIGGATLKPVIRKPRMLVIAAIPDDHTVKMDGLDHRGAVFNKTGNFELPAFDEFQREDLILGGLKPEAPRFSRPDFAFNRICDPDANLEGLKHAGRIIEANAIPTLNMPDKILGTRRDTLYQRFADFDGVIVPKTVRIAPRYCKDVRDFLERGEIRLPAIFRPAGGHNSRGVFLINALDDTKELERFAFDGRDYYISELHDCRDADGLYRKFRMVYVDGKLYPRHLFVSDNWCVDAKNKIAEDKFFEEEAHFLKAPASVLGDAGMEHLNRFCAALGLDFFGLDLSRRPDGGLVMFEANACMTMFKYSQRDYLVPYVENIRTATRNMLLRFHLSVSAKN